MTIRYLPVPSPCVPSFISYIFAWPHFCTKLVYKICKLACGALQSTIRLHCNIIHAHPGASHILRFAYHINSFFTEMRPCKDIRNEALDTRG
ncbi:hypothetical protein GDO81_023089 [Engystomops pustulosus]|uniref:Uncharacterized protein n=1 Tax=Engystomops pustulosus TaxID=76066 RepID=A0AAV6YSX5_ENGPU|nr:hypothetical protein GDO81_023089 [Engystomops pustulosus]